MGIPVKLPFSVAERNHYLNPSPKLNTLFFYYLILFHICLVNEPEPELNY